MTRFELRRADCIRAMAALAPQSIDLVVTSPPYNLGIRYSTFRDGGDRSDYLGWCRKWSAEVHRLLRDGGSFFLNVGSAPSNPMLPHEIVMRLQAERFVLQNTIHWIKSIAVDARTFGHFKPINSPRYLNDCHEYVFHFTKNGDVKLDRLALGVPYQDKSNIARWSHTGGRDRRCRGNTWFVPYETIKSRDRQRPHPATFPVELAENCIRLHGVARVQRMLDPFLGIGNSALAALRCGVPTFVGLDIDAGYVREARRRIKAARQASLASSH